MLQSYASDFFLLYPLALSHHKDTWDSFPQLVRGIVLCLSQTSTYLLTSVSPLMLIISQVEHAALISRPNHRVALLETNGGHAHNSLARDGSNTMLAVAMGSRRTCESGVRTIALPEAFIASLFARLTMADRTV